MMLRVSDLRHKDIVNVRDGRRLGFIRDVDIDVQNGNIRAVVVPGEGGFFPLFTRADEVVVPWRLIKRIGVDVILVELENVTSSRRLNRRAEKEYAAEEEPPQTAFAGLPPGAMLPLSHRD